MIVPRVRVVLRKTVVGDWRFNYLSGSHLQSQVKSCRQMMVLMPLVVVWIGQFCRDADWSWKPWKLQWLVGCCFAVIFDPTHVLSCCILLLYLFVYSRVRCCGRFIYLTCLLRRGCTCVVHVLMCERASCVSSTLGPARQVDSLETVYMRKSWLAPQGHPVSPTEWPYPWARFAVSHVNGRWFISNCRKTWLAPVGLRTNFSPYKQSLSQISVRFD